jgi:hypothetical protein
LFDVLFIGTVLVTIIGVLMEFGILSVVHVEELPRVHVSPARLLEYPEHLGEVRAALEPVSLVVFEVIHWDVLDQVGSARTKVL